MNLSPHILHRSLERMTILVALLAASALAAQAQVIFSPPQNISNDSTPSAPQFGQQMLVNSHGDIYIAWNGRGGAPSGCYICFSRSSDGGITFSAPVSISSGSSGGFSMVLDSLGNPYIAWALLSSGPGTGGIFISRSTDRGATFSPPATVTNIQAGPQIAVDSSGKVDVVWANVTGQTLITPGGPDNPPQYAFDFTAFFSQSSDGGNTFSPAAAVFTSQSAFSPRGPSVQLATDATGNVYVLGEGGAGDFVLLARSNNGGTSFAISNVENLSGSAAGTAQMALDAAGNIDVVWEHWVNRNNILFSRSTDAGATFSTPQNLTPSSPGAENPKIAVDSQGNINIAWLDYTPSYFAVFFSHSKDGGTTFSTPLALSTDPSLGYGLGPYSISMATGSQGNVKVAWEDNDSANRYQNPYQSTQWNIYLASSIDGGATFQGPVNVTNASDISASPVIALDASSNAYISWMKSPPPSSYNFNVYFSRSVALSSVALSGAALTGGSSSTGTVALNGPAPAGGAVISLSSSDPSADVPATVTIPAGTTSATFTVTTSPVPTSTTAIISAVFNGAIQTASITIAPPVLTSLILNPSSVTGGSSSTGTVTLNGPAPAGGAVVTLSNSNSSIATVPSSVTVSPGFINATFSVSTRPLLCSNTAAIGASFNSATSTANLAVSQFAPVPPQACAIIGRHGFGSMPRPL